MPNEQERKHLAKLMYMALCDLRTVALDGRVQQAKDLAEAFHNIPLLMHTADFSFSAFREFPDNYQRKYQDRLRFDYLQEWEKLNIATP